MTEFCPLSLDTVTKRRFWEALPERDKAWLCNNPEWLPEMFERVAVIRARRADSWERQWKRREWRRV